MSSIIRNLFSDSFSTYADALYMYLEHKGIEKKWLAKKITPEGQKVASTQEKLSRWKREGTKPNDDTRKLIDEILSINIKRNNNGEWVISRTEQKSKKVKNSQSLDEYRKSKASPSLEDKLKEYESRKADSDFSDTERGLLLEYLLSHAESLSEGLRRLVEIEKDRDRQ